MGLGFFSDVQLREERNAKKDSTLIWIWKEIKKANIIKTINKLETGGLTEPALKEST